MDTGLLEPGPWVREAADDRIIAALRAVNAEAAALDASRDPDRPVPEEVGPADRVEPY